MYFLKKSKRSNLGMWLGVDGGSWLIYSDDLGEFHESVCYNSDKNKIIELTIELTINLIKKLNIKELMLTRGWLDYGLNRR